MYRAGGVAAALSLAVSGGAYAATQLNGSDVQSLSASQANMGGIGSSPSTEDASGLTVETTATQVVTETVDEKAPYETVEKETSDLPEGETQVETEGVDGVTRTTYQVTTDGGAEVSRTVLSTVQVTERVDEVILVGTGPTEPALGEDGTTAASAQAIAQAMMASYGWGEEQFSCLVNLWNRESNWNYQAMNASSGAYGIPQALPGSKMSSVASDWQTNPRTQITWGLGYISDRYGSPCGAWAHSESTGWY